MKISSAFPSKYLKAADLEGDVTLTISEVKIETVGQGNEASDLPVVYFHDNDKGLVLNKTNAGTISGLYGDDTDGWEGNAIALYATEVEYAGKMMLGIRVRLRKPAAAATAAPVAAKPNGSIAAVSALQTAKIAAWRAWKSMNPTWDDAKAANELGDYIHLRFQIAKDKLGAAQWQEMASDKFKPVGPQFDEPAMAGAAGDDEIPFSPDGY